MAIEVLKEEAEEILAKSRHKEIKESFKILADLLKQNSTKDIVEAIKRQTEKIDELLVSLKMIKPNVNVELHQDETIKSLYANTKLVLSGLEEIKDAINILNKQTEWDFKIKRDKRGYIETVNAMAVLHKSKYQA